MVDLKHYEAMRNALSVWKKFAWYATGKSGHGALEMPLWYALVFEKAVQLTDEALSILCHHEVPWDDCPDCRH